MKFHPLKICMVNYMNGEELDNENLYNLFLDDFKGVDFSIKYFSTDLNQEIYLGDMFIHKKTNKIYTFSLFNKIYRDENDIPMNGISSFGFVNIEDNNYVQMIVKSETTFSELRKKKTFFKNLDYIGNIFRHKTINQEELELNGIYYNKIHSDIMRSKQFKLIGSGTVLNFNSIKNYEFNILEDILNGDFNLSLKYKKITLSGMLDFSHFTGEIFQISVSTDKFKELYFDILKDNKMTIASMLKNRLSIDERYLNDSIALYKNYLVYLNNDGEIVEYNGEIKCINNNDNLYRLTSNKFGDLYQSYIPSLTIGYEKKLLALI